jgi:1,4-dihydroxy-2-naphthoate octaprenyltransferase
MSLMAAGLALAAAFLPGRFVALYATCLLMSVAYSVPPVRLKAVAGADWVINLAGFGTLTFLAGWASTARSLTTAGLLLALGFGALFAALYPLTQLYQFDEDLGRGDHTFALALGKKRSLGVALLAVLLAFSLFGWAGASGVRGPRALVLAGALGVALTAWLLVLLPWYRRAEVMSPSCHQRGMHWALGAWAVTDLAVLAGFA